MENLSNVDDQNGKSHPKPTDDPGAKIETVTPDLKNTKDKSEADSDDKENMAPEVRENNKESDHAEIETVTPDE